MVVRGSRSAIAFYASTDGGKKWRVRAVRTAEFRIPKPRIDFVRYVPTSIAGPDLWWIAPGRARPFVSVTRDGGRSWQTFRPPALPETLWWEITGADDRNAWLTSHADRTSAIYATRDGGRTWRRLNPR
jgi:photosystem II stability/assembly factor-like uncharacterized protein